MAGQLSTSPKGGHWSPRAEASRRTLAFRSPPKPRPFGRSQLCRKVRSTLCLSSALPYLYGRPHFMAPIWLPPCRQWLGFLLQVASVVLSRSCGPASLGGRSSELYSWLRLQKATLLRGFEIVYVSTSHMCLVPAKAREAVKFPKTRVAKWLWVL